jgi:hypothetical protein
MVLGVKGKWKERKGGSQDYPSQPEMAHTHEIHNVMQNRVVGWFFFLWLVVIRNPSSSKS